MSDPICSVHHVALVWVAPDPRSSTQFAPHWRCEPCYREWGEALDAGADWHAAYAVMDARRRQALMEVTE
jgi:hypothetical protein